MKDILPPRIAAEKTDKKLNYRLPSINFYGGLL